MNNTDLFEFIITYKTEIPAYHAFVINLKIKINEVFWIEIKNIFVYVKEDKIKISFKQYEETIKTNDGRYIKIKVPPVTTSKELIVEMYKFLDHELLHKMEMKGSFKETANQWKK